MKDKIKYILISLFILLPISLLSNDKIVIEYWTPFTGGDARPMQFIVDKFNAEQNDIVVNMKVINWADYYPILIESIKNNTSPDVAVVHGSRLAELISQNQLEEIENIEEREFTPNTIKSVVFDGKYYGIPIDTHLLMTYYNKKYIKDSSVLTKKMSPEQFVNFFSNLKNNLPKDITSLGQPIDNVYPFWIWYTFYNQIDSGGKYIENNKAAFNNSEALKALNFLIKLRDSGIYSKYINDSQSYNMFKYQKSAVLFTGGWATWNFEQNKDLDFEVLPFIQVFDHLATWSDSHTLAIPKGKKQESVIKFANFVASHGILWSAAGHIPSKLNLLNSQEFKKQTKRTKGSEYLKFTFNMPKHKKLWRCNDKMTEIFADMMQSKKSAEDTLNRAEKEINKILE